MLKAEYADYMRCEEKDAEIVRPGGSGDYLFLYFPQCMEHISGGKSFISEKNACVLYAPDEAHQFRGAPDFINSYVHFTVTGGELSGFDIPMGTIFYPDCYEELNEITRTLKNEMIFRGEHYEEMIDLLLRKMLILIDRSISGDGRDSQRKAFDRLRFEILSNISDNVSIDSLAKRMCMSRSRFFGLYSEYYGISPKKDILRARMEKASVLLTNNAKTVMAVANEVGFASVEHFTRYYKEYFGKSPRK